MPAESAPRAGPAAALPRGKPERGTKSSAPPSAEARRLEESRQRTAHWKRWGPYLSERQWGTVREDYSEDGTAWESSPHAHARSRAYRWGEDGLAGISDNHQRLCFALALWNGRDPILKERLFGLGGIEGNHGEDVKEYYFYLDSTPTHSYMKWLYKYPQRAYPYEGLVAENRRRGRAAPEFELLDTGVFEEDRYFDVQVEYAKDGINEFVVHGAVGAVNPARTGTKVAARYRVAIAPDGPREVRLRLTDAPPGSGPLGAEFEAVFDARRREADEFYAEVVPDKLSPDGRQVMRQALAGMLWSKQWYHYDVQRWLDGDPAGPPPPATRLTGRNHRWRHLYNEDVISMPDKWEYPWYAAWDLAFHCVALALVDPDFAKNQLVLFLREWYMHPSGQLPAYEWALADVNPPVHAWADSRRRGPTRRRGAGRSGACTTHGGRARADSWRSRGRPGPTPRNGRRGPTPRTMGTPTCRASRSRPRCRGGASGGCARSGAWRAAAGRRGRRRASAEHRSGTTAWTRASLPTPAA